jgi:hypothetical protein
MTILMLVVLGIATKAQHVWLFGEGVHMRMPDELAHLNGASGGLRFPAGRYLLDLRGTALKKGSAREGTHISHVAGSLMFARSFPIKGAWTLDLGVEAGYAFRKGHDYTLHREERFKRDHLTAGPVLGIRYVKSHWIQPYLTMLPAYEFVLDEQWYSQFHTREPVGTVWVLMLRAGVSVALPSPG